MYAQEESFSIKHSKSASSYSAMLVKENQLNVYVCVTAKENPNKIVFFFLRKTEATYLQWMWVCFICVHKIKHFQHNCHFFFSIFSLIIPMMEIQIQCHLEHFIWKPITFANHENPTICVRNCNWIDAHNFVLMIVSHLTSDIYCQNSNYYYNFIVIALFLEQLVSIRWRGGLDEIRSSKSFWNNFGLSFRIIIISATIIIMIVQKHGL